MANREGPGRAIQLVGSLLLAVVIIVLTVVFVTARIGANPEWQAERDKARQERVEDQQDAAEDQRDEAQDAAEDRRDDDR